MRPGPSVRGRGVTGINPSTRWISLLSLATMVLLAGCLSKPAGVTPVSRFDFERYLGRWYEIARLDHSFERGLTKVTADYSVARDGVIRVVNRGYSAEQDTWKEAVGKARFVDKRDQGHLKVSFFGPFYSSYVIFELDEHNYQYAFVSGPDTSYLWLLARTPSVSDTLKETFKTRAAQLGFPVEELIWLE